MHKILFQEKQKFTQWWLWLILLAPFVYFLYTLFSPMIAPSAASSGNISVSIAMPTSMWVTLLLLLLILLFMYLIKMTTVIDAEKIKIKHMLFLEKIFKWEDIESAEIIKYGFVGYGIRISLNHGTVYNVKGNKGLFIKMKNGKKRLIGTQRPEELKKVIQNLAQ